MVSRLPQTTEREFNAAVQAAKDAYPKWRNTALPTRSRVMFKFQELIRQHMVCCNLRDVRAQHPPIICTDLHDRRSDAQECCDSGSSRICCACRTSLQPMSPWSRAKLCLMPVAMSSGASVRPPHQCQHCLTQAECTPQCRSTTCMTWCNGRAEVSVLSLQRWWSMPATWLWTSEASSLRMCLVAWTHTASGSRWGCAVG